MVTALRDKTGQLGHSCTRLALLAVLVQSLAACSTVGFYTQAVSGQWALMRSREPIDAMLGEEQLSPQLRSKLELVQEIRQFAGNELKLPIAGQYTSYVELGRPYAVWNVFATPEFSMEPVDWCFPVAGCVSYRGYFDEQDAQAYARKLRLQGLDVYVGGVAAYSSLGWFSDPVLSSFIGRADWQLASLIFHELAHQVVYVAGDTDFNESFATAVEMEGLSRWLDYKYPGAESGTIKGQVDTFRARQQQFVTLIRETTDELSGLYQGNHDEMTLRDLKEQRFDRLRTQYGLLRAQWDDYPGYDQWFMSDLNNAQLVTVTLYNQHLPFFQRLLADKRNDLEVFYKEVKKFSRMPKLSREAFFAGEATERASP